MQGLFVSCKGIRRDQGSQQTLADAWKSACSGATGMGKGSGRVYFLLDLRDGVGLERGASLGQLPGILLVDLVDCMVPRRDGGGRLDEDVLFLDE